MYSRRYRCEHFFAIIIIGNYCIAYFSCLFIKVSKGKVENTGTDLTKADNFFYTSSRAYTHEFIIKKAIICPIWIFWQMHLMLQDKTRVNYKLYHKQVIQLCIFFNNAVNAFSTFADFKSHSQRLIIRQPSFLNALTVFVSLAMLEFILFSHHSVLVLGTTKYLQSLCPCQKQP